MSVFNVVMSPPAARSTTTWLRLDSSLMPPTLSLSVNALPFPRGIDRALDPGFGLRVDRRPQDLDHEAVTLSLSEVDRAFEA